MLKAPIFALAYKLYNVLCNPKFPHFHKFHEKTVHHETIVVIILPTVNAPCNSTGY